MNFQSYWLTTKHFSATKKDFRAQMTEIMTVCYQFDELLESPVIKYQCLICQMKAGVFFNEFAIILINNKTFFINKQRLQSPKDRNRDCLFTILINFCSHQWSNVNVWYVKYKLELLQWILNVPGEAKGTWWASQEGWGPCMAFWAV